MIILCTNLSNVNLKRSIKNEGDIPVILFLLKLKKLMKNFELNYEFLNIKSWKLGNALLYIGCLEKSLHCMC